jgi:hypothetical protein
MQEQERAQPSRPLLAHEYEAQFAGLHCRSTALWHEMDELRGELEALTHKIEDRPGSVLASLKPESSVVIHLRKASDLAK